MKAVSVKEIKQELLNRTPDDLMALCLRLSKFKKENKELLTYLLFESDNEEGYKESVKSEIDNLFGKMNKKSYYYMNKSARKILSNTKKYIRYSGKKDTEVELLIYFCKKLRRLSPSISRSTKLRNLYRLQLEQIEKKVSALHEDLQFDFEDDLELLRT